MVKLFQMLQGDAEYFGLLLTKSGVHKVPQMVTEGVFLLQCTMKSQFLCTKNGFTALKLVANNF